MGLVPTGGILLGLLPANPARTPPAEPPMSLGERLRPSAQITPPVGFNLFVLQNMSGRDSFATARAAFPFFLLLVVAVVVVTAFHVIALYLPRLALSA